MNVLWQLRRADVRTVLRHLNERRKTKLAYTTVMTVMTHLFQKGLLRRSKVGRGYVYRAVTDKGGFVMERLADAISSIASRYHEPVASNLLNALEDSSPEEIDALVAELKKRGYIE